MSDTHCNCLPHVAITHSLSLPLCAEPRLQQRQLRQQQQQLQQKQHHPYLFLTVPRGRANAGAVVQGFEIVEEADDDDDDDFNDSPLHRHQQDDDDADDDDDNINERANDDDDDDADDDIDELPAKRGLSLARNGQLVLLGDNDMDDEQDDDQDDDEPLPKSVAGRKAVPVPAVHGQPLLKTAKPTQMMVARDQAGAIMVPDGIVEIEGQSVVDEKTGKAALLVPRAALDAIPDGAVVALMERSLGDVPAIEQERANRVIVRRRKNNGRRNAQRRRRGGRPVQRRRVNAGNQRRRRINPNNNRQRGNPNVRVVRPGNRRRGNAQRRRGGQVALQG